MNDDNFNLAKFGSIDTKTGLTQEGYIDRHGNMVYKNPGFWRRLFCKPPRKTEYVGTTMVKTRWIWSSNFEEYKVAVYREYNPFTNQTYSIWAKFNGEVIYGDPNAWDTSKTLVSI